MAHRIEEIAATSPEVARTEPRATVARGRAPGRQAPAQRLPADAAPARVASSAAIRQQPGPPVATSVTPSPAVVGPPAVGTSATTGVVRPPVVTVVAVRPVASSAMIDAVPRPVAARPPVGTSVTIVAAPPPVVTVVARPPVATSVAVPQAQVSVTTVAEPVLPAVAATRVVTYSVGARLVSAAAHRQALRPSPLARRARSPRRRSSPRRS